MLYIPNFILQNTYVRNNTFTFKFMTLEQENHMLFENLCVYWKGTTICGVTSSSSLIGGTSINLAKIDESSKLPERKKLHSLNEL